MQRPVQQIERVELYHQEPASGSDAIFRTAMRGHDGNG